MSDVEKKSFGYVRSRSAMTNLDILWAKNETADTKYKYILYKNNT